MSAELRFDGKVAIVTGAGAGLGRLYALGLAQRGAKIVVNDLGGSVDGSGPDSNAVRPADAVCNEIKAMGGEAVPDYNSVVDGDKVVKTAVDKFGRIDIIINNAGILRDVSFAKMSDADWSLVHKVHLDGAYSICRAAWPHMRKQEYGRILNVTSTSGLFGNFGQANYSSAKLAIVGLTNTLSKEGAKKNIKVNIIAPGAGSRMTAQVMPPEFVEAWKPDFVMPMALALVHENVPVNGQIFQAGGGWFTQVSWQRSDGLLLDIEKPMTPEMIMEGWDKITALPARSGIPDQFSADEGQHKDQQMTQIIEQISAKSKL